MSCQSPAVFTLATALAAAELQWHRLPPHSVLAAAHTGSLLQHQRQLRHPALLCQRLSCSAAACGAKQPVCALHTCACFAPWTHLPASCAAALPRVEPASLAWRLPPSSSVASSARCKPAAVLCRTTPALLSHPFIHPSSPAALHKQHPKESSQHGHQPTSSAHTGCPACPVPGHWCAHRQRKPRVVEHWLRCRWRGCRRLELHVLAPAPGAEEDAVCDNFAAHVSQHDLEGVVGVVCHLEVQRRLAVHLLGSVCGRKWQWQETAIFQLRFRS